MVSACTGTSGFLLKSINLMYRYWDLPSYLQYALIKFLIAFLCFKTFLKYLDPYSEYGFIRPAPDIRTRFSEFRMLS